MTNSTPARDDDQSTDSSSDWVEKDGDVVDEKLEEILPQGAPADGDAPLP